MNCDGQMLGTNAKFRLIDYGNARPARERRASQETPLKG